MTTHPDPAGQVVYVVEDDAAVRDSLLLLLEVKGFAGRGFESADAFLEACRPDWAGCLLLDLRMPGMSGLELQAVLAQRGVALPIVIISAHGDVAAARLAFKAGAVDFLEKPLDETALLTAVAAALGRDRDRRDVETRTAPVRERLGRLTGREREVLWLVADGWQNRDIAATLGLSPRTVEIYKARMLEKLGARNLAELLQLLQGVPRDETSNQRREP